MIESRRLTLCERGSRLPGERKPNRWPPQQQRPKKPARKGTTMFQHLNPARNCSSKSHENSTIVYICHESREIPIHHSLGLSGFLIFLVVIFHWKIFAVVSVFSFIVRRGHFVGFFYRVFQVNCMIKNRNISAPRAARSLPKTSTWSLWNPVLSLLTLNTMEAYITLSMRPYTKASYWQNR